MTKSINTSVPMAEQPRLTPMKWPFMTQKSEQCDTWTPVTPRIKKPLTSRLPSCG